jgi:hypothetical protein
MYTSCEHTNSAKSRMILDKISIRCLITYLYLKRMLLSWPIDHDQMTKQNRPALKNEIK